MKKPAKILLVLTGHTLDLVRQKYGDFDSQFFAVTNAQHTVYAICDKWPTLDIPDITQFSGIVFSGSASMLDENKPWMHASIKIISQALEKEIPLLGICFGHQLLGKTCGALVGPNQNGRALGSRQVMISKSEDPLLKDMPTPFWAQVSHRDVIQTSSPHFEVLAQSSHDPIHMIKAGKSAWGVQFHPEWNTHIMRNYLQARKEIFDQEWGIGSAEHEMKNIKSSNEASTILNRFVAICQRE